MSTLDDAIQAIRMGNREEGRQLLEEILEADESNEEIWLWLTTVVDTDEDREVCLENVLALNPNNAVAQKSLEDVRSGTFNARDIMQAAIEEEEEPVSGATFLDEFRQASDDEDEDGELVLPSTMAKSKSKSKQAAKKKGSGFKLNPRLLVLAVLAVLIICALAGVAAYNMAGGGVEPSDGPVGQETPASGETEPVIEPTPVDTPAVPPTDTPAPTRTPFQLPTSKPTDLPTPTATSVVAPTP